MNVVEFVTEGRTKKISSSSSQRNFSKKNLPYIDFGCCRLNHCPFKKGAMLSVVRHSYFYNFKKFDRNH